MFLTIARRPNRAAPMLRAHDTATAALDCAIIIAKRYRCDVDVVRRQITLQDILAHVTPTTITCTAHWNQEV